MPARRSVFWHAGVAAIKAIIKLVLKSFENLPDQVSSPATNREIIVGLGLRLGPKASA
ncbi:MAG: hypothetical protein HY966_07270 [Ignavibacteriales bacterium]|nr:hypothetical protein [Ignavibacteriales bacterium]